MEMEFKRFEVADVDTKERVITGHAAVFGNKDSYGDVIEAGAFKRTVDAHKEGGGRKVKVFYNHMHPIGLPQELREDERGLYTESKISATPRGDEVLQLVSDGVINEMSIGYQPVKSYGERGDRHLTEIKLFEYGPVDFAANDQALITGVKGLADRLRQGQTGEATIAEVKQAISQLQAAIDRADPSNDTPHKSSDSSLIDTRILTLTAEAKSMLADCATILKTRSYHYG